MCMDCVLFDFATKNLHLATIFCHLVDKCDLRILLISSPAYRCFNTQSYIYPFQNLSLVFILKIFLKFRKFQPGYSYKIYSYKEKRVYGYEH